MAIERRAMQERWMHFRKHAWMDACDVTSGQACPLHLFAILH